MPMADDWLRIVPTDPLHVPLPDRRAAAVEELLSVLDGVEEVEWVDHGDVLFIDAGEAFRTVRCPGCDADLMAFWSEKLGDLDVGADEDAPPLATDLRLVVPCCELPTSLDQLVYDAPCAWARMELSATNPAPRGMLPPAALTRVATALGHDVRQVLQHL